MEPLPLVSVGVPVYNGEDDLSHAVESLLAQSYSQLEIIISDNASTDRTQQVALQLAARDRRVRYHRLERNIGPNSNFDRLRSLATGEYFMWNGADDIRPPGVIEALVGALTTNPRAVMAYGPIKVKIGELEHLIRNEMNLLSDSSGRRIGALTRNMRHIAMEYGLYRLAVLRKARYESEGRYGDDYLICLQMALVGPIEYVDSPMMVYRMQHMPPASPMGDDLPCTMSNLLVGTKRMWKSWSVLTWGCVYLIRLRHVSLIRRVTGVLAHFSTFVVRYRKRLGADVLLISCSTLAAFPRAIWRFLRRVPLCEQVDSRMKRFLQRG